MGEPAAAAADLRLRVLGPAAFAPGVVEGQGKPADGRGAEHEVEVARPQGAVAQVEQEAVRPVEVAGPTRHLLHQGEVVHVDKADGEQQQANQADHQRPGAAEPVIAVLVQVGSRVGRDEQRDHRQPERGHEDRADIDELPVEHLHKEQRRHPEVDRKGDGEGQGAGQLTALGTPLAARAEMAGQGDAGRAEHHVHEQDVAEKGEEEQRLEPAPGGGDGVGRGDEQGGIHGDLLCGIAGPRRARPGSDYTGPGGRQRKNRDPAGPDQGGVSASAPGRRMQCSGQ